MACINSSQHKKLQLLSHHPRPVLLGAHASAHKREKEALAQLTVLSFQSYGHTGSEQSCIQHPVPKEPEKQPYLNLFSAEIQAKQVDKYLCSTVAKRRSFLPLTHKCLCICSPIQNTPSFSSPFPPHMHVAPRKEILN